MIAMIVSTAVRAMSAANVVNAVNVVNVVNIANVVDVVNTHACSPGNHCLPPETPLLRTPEARLPPRLPRLYEHS